MNRPRYLVAPVLAFVATVSMAEGQTMDITSLSRVSHDDAFPTMTKVYRQLSNEEVLGLCTYQSDQKIELQKFDYTAPAPHDAVTPKSDAIKTILAALPTPETITNSPMEALRCVDKLQEEVTKEQISPAWVDNAWIDATRLASNGFGCSNLLQVLSLLNCYAVRKRITDTAWGDALGHDFNERMRCRMKLFYAGYEVKYDKTFGIWRITGTNAPAVKLP